VHGAFFAPRERVAAPFPLGHKREST